MENKRKNGIPGRPADNGAKNRTKNRYQADIRFDGGGKRRVPGYGTRRVNTNRAGRERPAARAAGEITDAERRRRIERARKQERLRKQRYRAAAGIIAAAAAAVILMFMTPIFDIREIRVEGNNVVEIKAIEAKIGDYVGANLFSASKRKIRNKMLEISQVDDAEIDKKLFPPSLVITVNETKPAAYMLSGNTIIVVNSELKIIDDANSYDTDKLPSVSGISISSYKLNEPLKSDSEEKEEILRDLLGALEDCGLLEKTTYISIDDLTNIKFTYDNRIEVMCGSQLELDRKIRMFREAMNSSTMDDNSIGTMDLSVPGHAVYKS